MEQAGYRGRDLRRDRLLAMRLRPVQYLAVPRQDLLDGERIAADAVVGQRGEADRHRQGIDLNGTKRDRAERGDAHVGVVGVADHTHLLRNLLHLLRSDLGDQLGEPHVDRFRGRRGHIHEPPAPALGVLRGPRGAAWSRRDVHRVGCVVHLPQGDACLEGRGEGEGLERAARLAPGLHG